MFSSQLLIPRWSLVNPPLLDAVRCGKGKGGEERMIKRGTRVFTGLTPPPLSLPDFPPATVVVAPASLLPQNRVSCTRFTGNESTAEAAKHRRQKTMNHTMGISETEDSAEVKQTNNVSSGTLFPGDTAFRSSSQEKKSIFSFLFLLDTPSDDADGKRFFCSPHRAEWENRLPFSWLSFRVFPVLQCFGEFFSISFHRNTTGAPLPSSPTRCTSAIFRSLSRIRRYTRCCRASAR